MPELQKPAKDNWLRDPPAAFSVNLRTQLSVAAVRAGLNHSGRRLAALTASLPAKPIRCLLTSFLQQYRSGPRTLLPPIKVRDMYPTRIALLFLSIALCSCAAPPARIHFDTSLKSRMVAWDGLGRDPNLPRARVKRAADPANEGDSNRKREQVLVSLHPYSASWWAVHNEMEAENDKRLARKLVICASCLHRASEGVTGTITAD
ncbi:MAG: hypothetical protein ACREEK_06210 [Bradyrhizobium sp.]